MTDSSTRLPAPCESPSYQQARTMAREKGVEEDVRWLCALLEAPFDLRCLLLVAGNLKNAIARVPESWALTEDFGPLRRAADWALALKQTSHCDCSGGVSLSEVLSPLRHDVPHVSGQ